MENKTEVPKTEAPTSVTRILTVDNTEISIEGGKWPTKNGLPASVVDVALWTTVAGGTAAALVNGARKAPRPVAMAFCGVIGALYIGTKAKEWLSE